MDISSRYVRMDDNDWDKILYVPSVYYLYKIEINYS